MGKVSRIDINTVLSDNFLVADYFDGYQKVCPITARGEAQDYLVGTDSSNRLLIACPKPKGETGHMLLDTGATAQVFDVESGVDGDILVCYVKDRQVVVGSVKNQGMSHSCQVNLGLNSQDVITKLISYRRDYVLYLFAIYKPAGQSKYKVKIAELLLPDWTYSLINTSFTLDNDVCDCLRNNLSILLIAFDGEHYLSYDFFMEEERKVKMTYPGSLLCFSAVNSPIDGEGILALFDVLGKKAVYSLDLDSMLWTDVKLQLNAQPQEMNVAYSDGFFHLFLSAKSGDICKLYHAARPMEDKRWSQELIMMPISGAITDFAINKAEKSRLGVSYDNKMIRAAANTHPYGFLTQNKASIEYLTMGQNGQWNLAKAIVDTQQKNIYEYPCFMTQAAFFDEKGLAYSSLEVGITSECNTEVVINNRTYGIKANEWLTVCTNAMGKLSIIQRANDFGVPDLRIQPNDDEKKEYTIVQHDRYSKKFQTISKEELASAKLHDGSSLVPPETASQCGELAELIQASFGKQSFNYDRFVKNDVIAHNMDTIYCTPDDKDVVFGAINPQVPLAFTIEFFDNDQMKFHNYSKMKQIPMLIASDGFWSRLCDFSRSVANKAVSLVKLTVQTVGKAVVAAVDFILDGVKQVVNFVVKTVKDILHAVVAVFDRFKIGFDKLFKWLAQLFSWEDIMASKKFLTDLINEQLDDFAATFRRAGVHLADNMGYLKSESGKSSERVKAGLPTDFDAETERKKLPQDSPFYTGQSNNVVFSRMTDLLDSPQGLCCCVELPLSFQDELGALTDDIMAYVMAFGPQLSQEMIKKKEMIVSAFDTTRVVSMIEGLGSILEMLLELAKNPLTAFLDGIGNLMAQVVAKIKVLLNTKIRIPLVSILLEKVFGLPQISVLDVMTTIIAIPYTIIYKLVCGTRPPSDDGMLGNAYGWLQGGYILSGLCAFFYYGLCVAGIFLKPENDNWISLTLFGVLPGALLLIWTRVNMAEEEVYKNSGATDAIASAMSYTSVAMFFLPVMFHPLVTLGQATAFDMDSPFALVDVLTVVFGITSIVIGCVDIAVPEKWTILDIVSQRNGIITGLADMCIALAALLKPNSNIEKEKEKDVNAVPPYVILAGAGGLLGLVESVCLFSEAIIKPYIKQISPRKGEIDCSGTVSVTFDTTMNTSPSKGGKVKIKEKEREMELPLGTWSDKTYTTTYSGLTKGKKHYLIVEGFRSANGIAMEEDRYEVFTKE